MKAVNFRSYRSQRKRLARRASQKFGRPVRWVGGHLMFARTGRISGKVNLRVPGVPEVRKPYTKSS